MANRVSPLNKNYISTLPSSDDHSPTLVQAQPVQPFMESPIRSVTARRILEERLYKKQVKNILEFRRKKVIKAELKRYYNLFQKQSYDPLLDENEEKTEEKPILKLKLFEDSQVKKIRTSAIVRKLMHLWTNRTIHYPIVFKKQFYVGTGFGHGFILENHDLTKHQFGPMDKRKLFSEKREN